MSERYKKFIVFYIIYSLVIFGLIYALSGCAGPEPKAMGECRALCRGDVQSFIDDTTQCICRERQELGRTIK